jgi:hypothetical protein
MGPIDIWAEGCLLVERNMPMLAGLSQMAIWEVSAPAGWPLGECDPQDSWREIPFPLAKRPPK